MGEASDIWTVGRMLDWCVGYLENKGEGRPRLSAEWLLSAATGLSRVELYTNFERVLNPQELDYMRAAAPRRASGAPLQYVTGEMPFRHLIISCSEGVLIPRPETEVLVDVALSGVAAAKKAGHMPFVLEIGTGSSCIASSIAFEESGAHVVATDISETAISLACKNLEKYGLLDRVELVHCDLDAGVSAAYTQAFDVLVSNPPYIPTEVVTTLPDEVQKCEPHLALDGGADGLDIFRRILAKATTWLRPGGLMCIELFEENVHAAATLTEASGQFVQVEVIEDLTHRPRILKAIRKGDLSLGGNLVQFRDAKIKTVDQMSPTRAAVDEMVRVLQDGGVVVMPTDSVYGIGALAAPHNPGHERIFEIKMRDRTQTLPWLIADALDLARFARDYPVWAEALAKEFWPGALTLVVYAKDIVPAEYVLPNGTIALRVPDSKLVRQAIRAAGLPLATTSANTHGAPSATTGLDVEDRLIEMSDLVLDAGPAPVAIASTIVDCTGTSPKILRQGAISKAEIERIAGPCIQ